MQTFREQGYPQLALNSWFGIVASARTPPEVMTRLEAEVSEAVRSANGTARLEDAGFGVTSTTSQEFARVIGADTVKWDKGGRGHRLQGGLSHERALPTHCCR